MEFIRIHNVVQMLALGALISLVAGYTSTATAADSRSNATFNQPIAKVQKAALDALSVIGCDVKKQEPTLVEGVRPHKMGLLVGSGGENVRIWLTARGARSTDVKVKTSKSFVGIAGQKTWDSAVLAEMKKSLGK